MSRKHSKFAAVSVLASGVLFCLVRDAGADATNFCQITLTRSDALDFPSKHAWDLFLVLNHPAVNRNIERGQPDCSKPIGTPGTTAVWETWRNAETEVFLEDGSEPPLWNDTSLPDEAPGSIPEPVLARNEKQTIQQRELNLSFHDLASRTIEPTFSPDGIFKGRGGIGETRMNRDTYEFIRRECLWSIEGQERYAKAITGGKKPALIFPPESMEVKAVWLDFERENVPEERRRTYYTAEFQGKSYGLTALHVLTKDLPNWFWATFHHVDAPDNPFEVPDSYGRPKILAGTVWENYKLGGTQTDFVTSTGQPTILSDHYVEFGFQRSSCITCHSTTTISTDGSAGPTQPMALCILSPDVGKQLGIDCKRLIGEDLFKPGTDQLILEFGTPLARWFQKDGKPFHFQTDFVYSITFRGRNETGPPPDRCLW